MKSYTDIEQSKNLAEILPIESADMHYSRDFDGRWFVDLAKYTSVKIPKYVGNIEEHLLPCWSLATLLNVLPLEVSINKQTDSVDTYYYIASCDARYCDVYSHRHINAIDACYEMIINLHEFGIL